MQYTNYIWRNNQPYSEMFDDIYYSSNQAEDIAGESEFLHVFFTNNNLPARWHRCERFVIGELGFGSGLNCILTIREWLNHLAASGRKKQLHYIAIEKYPLSPEAIGQLASGYAELKPYYDEIINHYPPAVEGRHTRHLFDNQVVMHYLFMDVNVALHDENHVVDAWYLDGFSPAKNPDMWSAEVFRKLARNSHVGSTCSTYSAAGFVKRNLEAAGFDVEKVSGHGNKRDMLRAELKHLKSSALTFKQAPWFMPPVMENCSDKKATIIGSGIAGLSLAYSLVQRGWQVTVIDQHGEEIKQASSNPAPIIYPRLSVNNDVDTEFFTTAYFYALYLFSRLQRDEKNRFWFDDGITQQMDSQRIAAIINRFQFNPDYVAVSDHLENGRVTVDYPQAGVLLPGILCEVLKDRCADRLKTLTARITGIKSSDGRWQCYAGDEPINSAEILIVANGTGINALGLPLTFPVEPVRGQVAICHANSKSLQIKRTVNAEVHITPAINSKHYLGATYTANTTDLKIDPEDNLRLFSALDRMMPGLFSPEDYCGAWTGLRTTVKDRVPVAGAVADMDFFIREYGDLCHGRLNKNYPPARYLKGLYISAAHGSRGFTSSFLCAEMIAALIQGEPLPVSGRVLNYLSPSRFLVNDLKKGRSVVTK